MLIGSFPNTILDRCVCYAHAPMSKSPCYTAATADHHVLYQISVQAPEAEVEFINKYFKKLRGRPARHIREDFCGTAYSACHWVADHEDNTAVGVDLHKPTLAWGMKHNVSRLTAEQQERIELVAEDVRTPSAGSKGKDAVLAMNFSYWIFMTREELRKYFVTVRNSLVKDGVFFLDHYGGYESYKEVIERRKQEGFTYVWDQAHFDPMTNIKTCYIHFEFPDGTKLKRAFTYTWRIWSLPEIKELLLEAGFKRVTIYWEGDDGNGGGDGIFKPATKGDADACFVCYITAEK